MGLDISLWIPNQEEFDHDEANYSHRNLSRTFCYLMCRPGAIDELMCRPGAIDEEPELDQIGRLTGVDVSPIYDMENYREEVDLAEELEFAENEEERHHMQTRAAADNARLEGNLDIVYEAITQLLAQLAPLTDLPARLQPTARDTLDREVYFADFMRDTGGSYTNNNFGQDLRSFKRFLEYARSKGRRTVFFRYG